MKEYFGKTIKISLGEYDAKIIKNRLPLLDNFHIAKIFMSNCIKVYDQRQLSYKEELAAEKKPDALLGTVTFPMFCADEVYTYLTSSNCVFSDAEDFIEQIKDRF